MDAMKTIEVNARVKEVGGEGSRVLEFIASTETPDRAGDIIDVAGWKLDNYLGGIGKGQNPIFAWSHDYSKLPVGKTISASADVRAKALAIRVRFPTIAELCTDPTNPSEEALFADTVYNMYKGGYLNAVSVGFRGLKYKTRDDPSVMEKPEWMRGTHFLEQELLEVSAVLVPCNQEALVSMRGMKSFNPAGVNLLEKYFTERSEEQNMTEELKALSDRIKSIEDAIEVKAGSRHSKETREELGKVSEAMKACHKGIKACYDAIDKMIEVAPVEEQSGTEDQDGGASDGREKPKPNAGDGKSVDTLDVTTASVTDIAEKLFGGK